MITNGSCIIVSLRCASALLCASCAAWLWRRSVSLLPATHPARAFAEGAGELAGPARRAMRLAPCGTPIALGTVWAWTVAVLSWSALLAAEILSVTAMLWDGYLPGV